ncbi:L-dopachrome tautomerase yellow-e [Cochliomyia hominivorax]
MKHQQQQHQHLAGNSCKTRFSLNLLPCRKSNHFKRNHKYDEKMMFTFGLIMLSTLLNLCYGVSYSGSNNNNNNHRLLETHRPTSFQLAKQWKLFSYNFLPHAPMHDMNFYNPSNILATGLVVTEDRLFVATPKLFSGVPSTLNYISRSNLDDSPVLQAYPDWSFATTGRNDFNCSDLILVSVYRLRLDSCNRLWVLDAGISRSLEDYEKTCPPKILVFDLKTNQVVRRIDFPSGVLRGESLFTNLIIDETTSKAGTCDDVFVYISDTVEPGIVVYDSIRDTTWRVSHPAMYPDPDFAEAEIQNDRFVLMDGIVGITFDEKKGLVYFQPFATDRIFSVTREVLRAGPIAINQVLPVKLVGKKSSQGIGIAVTSDGTLIFSPSTETAVASWNPNTNEQHILAQDKDHLQFISDITLTPHDPGYVYVISSKFHRFFLKNLNTNEINNRIVRIPLPGYKPTLPVLSPSPYSLKPYAIQNDLNSYYQLSNSLQPKAISPFFSRPAATSSHPYNFENSGIINYSLKNPFTALNQGESFPPRKELRNQDDFSFLESLAAITAAQQPSLPSNAASILHVHPGSSTSSGRGYFYSRSSRSADKETGNIMNLFYLALSVLIILSPCTHGMQKNNPYGYNPTAKSSNTEIPYEWNVLEYGFPSDHAKQQALANGNLIPTNAIPIDVQPHYHNKNRLRTFVTIPKFQNGIPYTLATISDEKGPNGPILEPYPNYEAHNNKNGRNCDAITSAFRVAITECNQMWVIDSGMIGLHPECPPQLILFDLNTDQVIHRYRFNNSLYTSGASLFVTPIVDVRDPPPRGSCRRTMVYVADVNYHGLVVYDFMQNNAWRIQNMYMYPDPNHGLHTVAGDSFILMDGIIGMATDNQNLYFHPMASVTEYAVPLKVIDNGTIFEHDEGAMHDAFKVLGQRSSECVVSAMDSNNNMFCVTFNPIELIMWNVNKPYNKLSFKKIPISSSELQFVSGMKVVRNHQGNEELWMLSNKFQKLATGSQNFNEVNFRIVVLPLVAVNPTTPNQDLHNKLVFKS